MTTNILERLADLLQAVPDRSGRWHADCPQCGAPGMKGGRPAYHFYLYHTERGAGAVCWSCGFKSSLAGLLRNLGDAGAYELPAPVIRPTAPPPWQRPNAWRNWRQAMAPKLDAIWNVWQAYRPFSRETISRAGLAVERLIFHSDERGWYHARYARLLIPIVREGVLIGIRGRAYHALDDGPKWLSASGSEMWLAGLERVNQNAEVIWCESLADRLLGEQLYPGIVFLASGGLSWQDEWLDRLAGLRPRYVLIWFDHDLSGNGSNYHEDEWREQRMNAAQGRTVNIPEPRGRKLVYELRRRGVCADLYHWPAQSPEHADLGWALMKELQDREA